MIFSFFGSYSYVFASVYQFQPREIGLAFLGVLPGFILAIITFGIFDKTLYAKARAAAKGQVAPEHRLYAALLGSIMMPIGLFWYIRCTLVEREKEKILMKLLGSHGAQKRTSTG
jgi:hypothetical protein